MRASCWRGRHRRARRRLHLDAAGRGPRPPRRARAGRSASSSTGRRPLLGEGVPRGDVSELLRARVVRRRGARRPRGRCVELGTGDPILVPFGGAEHDWAALELGSWLAARTRRAAEAARRGRPDRGGQVGRPAARRRRSARAAQRGVATEPVVAEPGRDAMAAAAQAGLLVVGLSDRWRQEGLGPMRSELAAAAPRRCCSSGAASAPARSRRARTSRASPGPPPTSGWPA